MGKLVRVSVMGFLLALALYAAPTANASSQRELRAKSTCLRLGICRDSCVRCWSSQGCPDYPNETCLCGASICP
jgi:hypothetical protein